MNGIFRLRENNTKVGTEILAGLTTFFAMAYIIFVNPMFLSDTGMDKSAVMLATCIASAIGCFLTGFIANVPFAQAPGMGLNTYFTYSICLGMGYTWQQGLAIVLISGVIFLAVTISPLRKKVIASIPAPLKSAIGAGIGLFIALIGFLNAGIIVASDNLLSLNSSLKGGPLLSVIGIAVIAVLMSWKVKGAIFIGIIATTLIGIPMGITLIPESVTLTGLSLAPTLFKLDFGGLMSLGLLPLITAVLTFTIVDMFDTVGTLIGTAGNAGMLDKDGNLPRGDQALLADAIATCAGALIGTSTVTTYVESSTGISEGGRTGLVSVTVGVMFLFATVLAPLVGIIPSQATAPALIIVGVLMMASVGNINWKNFEDAMPSFMVIAGMPFSYSIANGIGLGFISYTLIKVCRGKAKEIPALLYVISAIFLLMYILANIGA